MIYTTRILLVVVVGELVAGGLLLARRTWRTVPQLPNVELNDPLIMPQLRELARAAEFGYSEDWNRLGEALLSKGFYSHAEQAFREALRSDSQDFRAQFGLAFSLDRTGRIPESSVEYRKLLQLDASSADQLGLQRDAQYALGRNALREQKPDEAERIFRQLSNDPPADYQVAKLLIRSGSAEQAVSLIEKNLAWMPDSLEFHFLNQRALEQLQQPRAAFEAGSMVDRSTRRIWLNFNMGYLAPLNERTGIGPILGELGEVAGGDNLARIEEVGQRIKTLLQDSPVFVEKEVDAQLLEVAVRREQPDRVLERLEKIRAAGREDAVTLEAEGDAWAMQGESDEAAKSWTRALTLTPSIRLHRKLANHFAERNRIQRDWHLGRAALLNGMEEYRGNRLGAAISRLRKAARFSPQDPVPWFYLGEAYLHLGESDDAQDAYQRCLELDPGHGRAEAKLNFLRDRTG